MILSNKELMEHLDKIEERLLQINECIFKCQDGIDRFYNFVKQLANEDGKEKD